MNIPDPRLRAPIGVRLLRLSTALACLLALSCAGSLLREQQVQDLNDDYRDRVFVAAQDIKPVFSTIGSDEEPEVIYPRGTKLKIWVESDEGWIRVRGTPVEEKREHNPGKVIMYIFREFLAEDGETEEVQDEYPVERLRGEIGELLQEVGG